MSRLFLLIITAGMALAYASLPTTNLPNDPNIRMEQLLTGVFDSRQIEYEWRHFWFTDQPSHLTPVRVHGGIGP